MAKKIEYGRMLHGGDYNPEQWLDRPDILKKDIEYFKKAHINTVSVGIFSWAVLEPEEGKYNLGWLEEIFNVFFQNVRAVQPLLRIVVTTMQHTAIFYFSCHLYLLFVAMIRIFLLLVTE